MLAELPPLSLYLHFPWCVSKCPYCDFNSHSLRGELPADAYIDALLLDLSHAAPFLVERVLSTVFLGGGTPSLFPTAALSRLLAGISQSLILAEDAEITLEANPGAVEHAAFAGYRSAGINRLSLGVQSFSDFSLKSLGRIHSAQDALNAFAEARAAGFDNINLDLMYALPEQTVALALADVEQAIALQPEHLSWYHLTLEPNTVFYQRPPPLPDADTAWDIQDAGAAALSAAGFSNYEVSAWAQPSRASRHNLNYWAFGDYLGLGAGAHGKLTQPSGEIRREQRAANPRDYLRILDAAGPIVKVHPVAAPDLVFEFMLNNLRLRSGFALSDFERRTGLPREALQPGLQRALSLGLLSPRGVDGYVPSALGWRFLDDLQAIFLPA